MSILFPAIGVFFTAFCIWLTVWTVNRRERWAKQTLAAVYGLSVLYVAGFGPACWISSQFEAGAQVVTVAYAPLTSTFFHEDSRAPTSEIEEALFRYSVFGASPNWTWLTSWDPVMGKVWKWQPFPTYR